MTLPSFISALRRWKRRKFLLLAMLLLFLLTVRLLWGWIAARQLDAQLAILRARGEPVSPDDVVYESVPDHENAFALQVQAAKAIPQGVMKFYSEEPPKYPPYRSGWLNVMRDCERRHAQAFALVRKAKQLTRIQIYQKATSPIEAMRLDHSRAVGHLKMALQDGALLMHAEGKDLEALERILDLLHLARSLHHDDLLGSQSSAWHAEAMACELINVMAPALQLDARPTTRPAIRPTVQRVIEVLLDETLAREGLRRSMRMERLCAIDTARVRARSLWLIRPLVDRDIPRVLPDYDALYEAAGCTNAVEAKRKMPRGEPSARSRGGVQYVGLDRSIENWFTRYFYALAERRISAVALACHLYRADHGSLPQRLEQLVPAYLPCVPADPLHEDGRALGYVVLAGRRPDGSDRPLLYYDAGETDIGVPDAPTYCPYQDPRPAPYRNKPVRQYRDLSRFVRPLPKTFDDDPQEADDKRREADQQDGAEQPQAQ